MLRCASYYDASHRSREATVRASGRSTRKTLASSGLRFLRGGCAAQRDQDTFTARPLMHNLMAGIAGSLGGRILHALIHNFVPDDHYYVARIGMEGPKGLVSVEARATDAISLAICTAAQFSWWNASLRVE